MSYTISNDNGDPICFVGETSLNKELQKHVSEVRASKIIRLPLPLNDPQQRRPDITKIECDLQWSPTVSLNTGLEKTIDILGHSSSEMLLKHYKNQITGRELQAEKYFMINKS